MSARDRSRLQETHRQSRTQRGKWGWTGLHGKEADRLETGLKEKPEDWGWD
jgi:hypothetical protein